MRKAIDSVPTLNIDRLPALIFEHSYISYIILLCLACPLSLTDEHSGGEEEEGGRV